jgi:hypothetical protein
LREILELEEPMNDEHAIDCDLDEDCDCEQSQHAAMRDSEADESDQDAQPALREGTLAWLESLEHVEHCGELVPRVHRMADLELLAADGSRRCRVIKRNRERCGAPPTRRYGICLVHLGGGTQDLQAARAQGRATQARFKARRQLLGIGPSRVGNPRSHARLAALERAQELADALVHAPLNDATLGTIERQLAANRALDATFPLQATTVELELPATGEDVPGMSWQAMQALASRLLDET